MNCTIQTFIDTVFDGLPDDERACLTLPGDGGGWSNFPASPRRLSLFLPGSGSWYFCVSSVAAPDAEGYFPRDRAHARFAYCLVLDDIGTKAREPDVAPSWVLESSAGNYQWGYLIDPFDVADPEGEAYYEGCQRALGVAGLSDAGAGGTYRVMRVPGSLHKSGFVSRVVSWAPERSWPLADLMTALGVEPMLEAARPRPTPGGAESLGDVADPVLDWLSERGLLTGGGNSKFIDLICPWAHEHTSGDNTAGFTPAGYCNPAYDHAFSCLHEHCAGRNKTDFLDWVAAEGGPDPRLPVSRAGEAVGGASGTGARAGFVVPEITGLPDLVGTEKKPAAVQVVTRDNVAWLLEQLDIVAEMNVAASRLVLRCAGWGEGETDQIQLRRVVMDMATRLRMKNQPQIDEVLTEIGGESLYHPMERWLVAQPAWGGEDAIAALAATVHTDNPLWPVYLRKWLIQVVEGVCGWRNEAPRSLPHVLTLAGGQGLGKSYWLGALGVGWLQGEAELHLSTTAGRDHQIAVLQYAMAELSELDGIFRKSDLSLLKAFISRQVDELRAPYARRAVRRARMTTFCASVNDTEFLADPTGSRRFWPVHVTHIDRDHGVDFTAVWRQAYALWCEGESFELSVDDDARRAELAESQHSVVHPEEEYLREYVRVFSDYSETQWLAMNRTEIMDLLFGKSTKVSPVQVANFGRAVVELFGPHRTIGGKQRCWNFPYHFTADRPMDWPDKRHLRSV